MFIVVHRTDTLPEMRALVNTDHIVSVAPVGGGLKSRFSLSNGEAWEVSLPFTRAINLLHAELEIVEPVAPVERRRELGERPAPPEPAPAPTGAPEGDRRSPDRPVFFERRRPPGAV
ncbi:MAG: hypothetical protein ACM3JG_07565 [Thiohalocapsa sp.]